MDKLLNLMKRIYFRGERKLNIHGIDLLVNWQDAGGRYYVTRGVYEGFMDPFYDRLRDEFKPTLVVDVGANYGFTALVCALRTQPERLILVEADPKVAAYARQNLKLNQWEDRSQVITAVAGSHSEENHQFSINPASSLDNRVSSKIWKKVQVPCIAIGELLAEGDRVYIKVDTQGYEPGVFEGMQEWLGSHGDWLIKTEFAPHWLRSQGHQPSLFLESLCRMFTVAELSPRCRKYGDSIKSLLRDRIEPGQAPEFVRHIERLNDNDTGWCDLLVAPLRANS